MERVVLTRTLHFDGPIPLLHSPTKTWARQHFTRTHTHTHTQTRNQCKTLSVTHRSGQPKGQQTAKKALFRIQVLSCMHLTCTTLSTHLSCTCAELAHPRHVTLVLGVLVLDQHSVTTAPTRATTLSLPALLPAHECTPTYAHAMCSLFTLSPTHTLAWALLPLPLPFPSYLASLSHAAPTNCGLPRVISLSLSLSLLSLSLSLCARKMLTLSHTHTTHTLQRGMRACRGAHRHAR